MPENKTNLHRVLVNYGVSPLEYAAMICPYYGIPFGPREMASWTVLECWNGPDADGEDDYSADQYLEAIIGMINKGWLCIQEPASQANTPASALIPQRDTFPPPIGAVVFTEAGYLLHARRPWLSRQPSYLLAEPDNDGVVTREAACGT